MITFDVTLEGTRPQIHVTIPMGDYLLDDTQLATAKETVEGITNLCHQSYDKEFFINNEPRHSGDLRDIVEKYRSLYLLKLLSDVCQRIKPLNDPILAEIIEKVEPLIERSESYLKSPR